MNLTDEYWGPLSDSNTSGMPCLASIAFKDKMILSMWYLIVSSFLYSRRNNLTRRYVAPYNWNRSEPSFSHGL